MLVKQIYAEFRMNNFSTSYISSNNNMILLQNISSEDYFNSSWSFSKIYLEKNCRALTPLNCVGEWLSLVMWGISHLHSYIYQKLIFPFLKVKLEYQRDGRQGDGNRIWIVTNTGYKKCCFYLFYHCFLNHFCAIKTQKLIK